MIFCVWLVLMSGMGWGDGDLGGGWGWSLMNEK